MNSHTLNCKFLVTEYTDGLTEGKIYEVKDGKFEDDDGDKYPLKDKLCSIDDLKDYFTGNKERRFSDKDVSFMILKN